jgi:hypothetical protein
VDREAEEAGTSQRKKRSWSDFSPRQRTAIALCAITELIMTIIAFRDLARRPAAKVRGWKPLWVVTCLVQPVGPVLYLLVGRRDTAR